MRYSLEHKAATRDALVRAACRVFREKGFDGVGVDQLSQSAGVTSGSFYKHFKGKSQLLLEVVRAGVDRVANRIRNIRASSTVDPVGGWINDFATLHTSAEHLASIGLGCNLPSLTPEIVRAGRLVKQGYEESVMQAVVAMLEEEPLKDEPDGDARALAILAILSGGANMARAVANEDTATRIAEAVRRACLLIARTALPDVPRSGIVWTPSEF